MDWGSIMKREPLPLLGLDLGVSSVKLVELSRKRSGHLVLEHAAIEMFAPGSIVDDHIERFDEVVEVVRRLIQLSGTRTRDVAMALPASAVMTRTVRLPAGLSGRELEIQVEAEASQFIPFSLDEVSLDFCEVATAAPGADEVEVFIVAARKEHVSDRQGLAEAAGLNAVVMDVTSSAARLALTRVTGAPMTAGPSALHALFEVGARNLSLQVLRQDVVLFERQQPLGGDRLSEMIAQQFGFSMEEAEVRKRSCDLPPQYRAQVLEPFVDTLAQDMARSLQFFFTSTPFNQVDDVLLAGGSADLPGLSDAVTRLTGAVCRVINPFDGLVPGTGVSMPASFPQATAYLRATGLALRRYHR